MRVALAASAAEAVASIDTVVAMVPAGKHARQVYFDDGVIANATPGSVLIDCTTVDLATEEVLKEAMSR